MNAPPSVQDPRALQAINTLKLLALDAVERAQSGHPGTPMGLATVAFELWTSFLRHDPKDPHWLGRDRFVLSPGHASMLLYALLHLSGYDLSLEDLKEFRKLGSKTPGHPEVGHTPGVETTTGPLGQGIGNAVGLALAAKHQQAHFGQPFEGIRVFAIVSDGDIMEGLSGEACSLAGHWGLDNLIVLYDDNRITIEGEVDLALSEDVAKRYEAYGFFVQSIDGHDRLQIHEALRRACDHRSGPSLLITRTHIAEGAPHAVDTAAAHGAPLGATEVALTKERMGWDPQQAFHVPDEVRALFAEHAVRLAKARALYNHAYARWATEDPARAEALTRKLAHTVPEDLYAQLIPLVSQTSDATRTLSHRVQQAVARAVPSLLGGSADLAPSTKTWIQGEGSITRTSFAGRNLHFGIREHAMGAVCNGLALFGGLIPYGSTFLVFSDYMRPAIRLSALMKQQCFWIYTHDSFCVGEDGPTHQPVEHLWSLRLIPGLQVVRPADGLEVAAAWKLALDFRDGPTVFSLTRQKIPCLERDAACTPEDLLRGAYIVQEAQGGKPELILMATGSEVHLAAEAKRILERQGRRVRLVSVLCLEQFAKQDAAYRRYVLPPSVAKVSIEAGSTVPWRAWVGTEGLCLGLDQFGASAPESVLADLFGFTASGLATSVEKWMSHLL